MGSIILQILPFVFEIGESKGRGGERKEVKRSRQDDTQDSRTDEVKLKEIKQTFPHLLLHYEGSHLCSLVYSSKEVSTEAQLKTEIVKDKKSGRDYGSWRA